MSTNGTCSRIGIVYNPGPAIFRSIDMHNAMTSLCPWWKIIISIEKPDQYSAPHHLLK